MTFPGRGLRRAFWGLLSVIAVSACEATVPAEPSAHTLAKPPATNTAIAKVRPTSTRSAELRSYLTQVQAAQITQGLLRQDGGGPDTPFTAEMLERNFNRLVFYNEYDSALQGRGGPSPLRRWNTPVRMQVMFGDSVPPSQRARDTADVRQYADRLARITGHRISVEARPNFLVIFASEDDRADVLTQAIAQIPGISSRSLEALRALSSDTYCVVAAFAMGSDPNVYTSAIAVVRSENPDLLRLSCIHEELAQGLGLANDSPEARPSIFNDDDEFALLTRHDELLLKMLYDPRLSPGMTEREAAPMTALIARELTGRAI